MKTQADMEALLDETAEFYSVPGRRSVRVDDDGKMGKCCYLSPNGRKCAAGRLMTEEELEIAHKLDAGPLLTTGICVVWRYLPDSSPIKVWRKEFLKRLQKLHDPDENWHPKGGLSPTGEALVFNIRCEIRNGTYGD